MMPLKSFRHDDRCKRLRHAEWCMPSKRINTAIVKLDLCQHLIDCEDDKREPAKASYVRKPTPRFLLVIKRKRTMVKP